YHNPDVRVPSNTLGRVQSYPFFHPLRVFFDPYTAGQVWVGNFGWGLASGAADGTGQPDTPPTVTSASFDPDPAHHVLSLGFSKDVSASLSANAAPPSSDPHSDH